MKTSPKPNVLLVIADQHHAGLMGCAGHAQAQTPQLDAFASGAMRFDAAYCQNPICTPSRVSLLSGQYPHNHGYFGLSGPAPFRLDNLFRHFRKFGYRTAGYGKLHLPEAPRNWIAEDVMEFGDAYEDVDGAFGRSEFLLGLERDGLRHLEDSWHSPVPGARPSIPLDARPSQLPYERTMERWCADRAMQFIERGGDTAPFLIQVAFQKPHHPLYPQQQFWDLYPEDLDLPEGYDRNPEGRSPSFQKVWHDVQKYPWEFAAEGDSFETSMRRAWRGTLACVSQVDDVFGRLVSFLQDTGRLDNTIVIYTSDHGCYHTIKGLPEKAPGIGSEDVCRVPLLVRVPGMNTGGAVCRELAELVDLAPTLTGLCGLPPMESVDGLDIRALLEGSRKPVREVAVTENAWSKALRWERWRFVHYQPEIYGEDFGELYDLAADPGETRNLYADPGSREVVSQCRRLLLEWLIRTTRLTTSHPSVQSSGPWQDCPRIAYPVCGDGTAPNSIQPRFNPERINKPYL